MEFLIWFVFGVCFGVLFFRYAIGPMWIDVFFRQYDGKTVRIKSEDRVYKVTVLKES